MKLSKIFVLIFSFACLISTGYFTYKVIIWKLDSIATNKVYKDIQNNIEIIKPTIEDEEVSYNIDFNALKEKNPDTIAYLKVNNTNIDYVVVKGQDNSYYLNHSFDKTYNQAGWVFADFHNKFDGTDKNIVIYGHNKKDGTMFGTLRNILKKEWYQNEDNMDIVLVTSDNTYHYQVFSIYTIEAEDYYINTIFNGNEFNNFINKIKRRSFYKFDVEVSGEDTILTLSTCIYTDDRLVLHAKLVNNDD